ncbi:MAG: type ISP restriction/modification enzyme, partial [Candidatus Binatia bacterium]
GKYAEFDEKKIRLALYRPFTKQFLFFDRLLNAEVYSIFRFFPTSLAESENPVICISDKGHRADFSSLMVNAIPDLHVLASLDGFQCFPFYLYDEDGSNRRENITDWVPNQFREHYGDKKIAKWDIFYYVYGMLHHPGYRERFADNLKRDLPRIPFADDFHAFAEAGKKLAQLHLDYEQLEPYPLQWMETPDIPLSYRVEKMRLNKEKTSLQVNNSVTLAGIPPDTFLYRLGNRSALEWIVDQYQVSEDKRSGIKSDPNRPDDEEYIVRLIGQVVQVSIETVKIVRGLPAKWAGATDK